MIHIILCQGTWLVAPHMTSIYKVVIQSRSYSKPLRFGFCGAYMPRRPHGLHCQDVHLREAAAASARPTKEEGQQEACAVS